ncbi:conserved hypothetical protein [Beutenbergia cavernae DSM 12333]|uniref:ABC transporter permease n=1 Tax=Beutenbergia cavernae (strain ATCC BAA-8 / DSM 12333 / CCUG 43141 / JCM 11478 / NBRC 16432 / NCIMB 13614 / HKI 0122) TaxID=471853 RepID=C5C5W2_BEUC1|nr:ABC transporter permease [Beutenbergia cavernae]ACQ82320.1 conserved hypothetical protein [Beutenbergia cavernae DSM 12333]
MATTHATPPIPTTSVPPSSTARSLVRSAAAETLRLRLWPAVWVLLGVWLLLNLTFAYVFNYLAYASGSESFAAEGVPREALLAGLLPSAVPGLLTNGMPMFGGAIMLTLGALAVGSGFGWGTWKTVFTQGPGRATAFGGTLLAVALGVVVAVGATLALDLAVSSGIAVLEGADAAWPDAVDLARSFGGGLLIMGMWAAVGALIGLLTRSPAIAIGLGLVWSLVVENLLRGAAGLLPELAYVTDYLPGTASGSLAGAVTEAAGTAAGGSPGVLTVLDGGLAVGVTLAYLVAAVLASVLVVRRRDIA